MGAFSMIIKYIIYVKQYKTVRDNRWSLQREKREYCIISLRQYVISFTKGNKRE